MKELISSANRYIEGKMSLLVAPLWLHSEVNDSEAFTVGDEFIVGDKYLVAPIITEGARNRDIYLPGGKNVRWKNKMIEECEDHDELSLCVVPGGTWLKSFNVPLDDISWWEILV